MKNLLFFILMITGCQVYAQLGIKRDSISSSETCNEAELKSDGSALHYFSDNINTFYYFDGESCNYVMKVTPRNNINKLKDYLHYNGFKYDPATSEYSKADMTAILEYKGKFVYLKIYKNKIPSVDSIPPTGLQEK